MCLCLMVGFVGFWLGFIFDGDDGVDFVWFVLLWWFGFVGIVVDY